jgi:hypothetical protein
MLAFDLPTINLGSLPDWFAAAGTVGAFWVTYLLLRKEQKARRELEEDRRQAQARLVSAWATTPEERRDPTTGDLRWVTSVVSRNGSDEPVYDVNVAMADPNGPHAADPLGGGPEMLFIWTHVLPPQYTTTEALWAYKGPSGPIGIEFRDASGRHWKRYPNGRLNKLET